MRKARPVQKPPILRHIVLIFLGLLLGFNVYLLNARNVAGNQMPMPFGIGSAVVQSGSMEPTYYKGDLLFVKEKSSYSVGDVVVYQSENILVVHRIIALDGETVITQGDANNAPDEPFSATHIKGCVVGRIPGVGNVIDFLKTPFGILLLIGCAVALTELSFLRERKAAEEEEKARHIRRMKREIEQLRRELGEEDSKSEDP